MWLNLWRRRNEMRAGKLTYYKIVLPLLLLCTALHGYAQQADSISIFRLMQQVEQQSGSLVYTDIEKSFLVKWDGENTPEALSKALQHTRYSVTVHEEYIFVLDGEKLLTALPEGWVVKEKETSTGEYNVLLPIETATSENKIYDIGNRYHPTAQERVTLTGTIRDFKTDKPMEGINVILRDPWTAAVTDRNGAFTLTLPKGLCTLEIKGLNITETRRRYMLYGDGETLIELEEETHMLSEVVIISGRVENVKETRLGMEILQPAKLKNIPTALGEVDILKMVQSLPGVKTVGEASTGYNVRGGSTDQNLLLLNGGTIYNPSHLFGFFTAFNSDMVKDMELYKSSIPSRYGGRISSVLNITGKEANKEKFTGSAGIGLVTSKLNLEIPIVRERTSLLLSGRTTYSDWILKRLPEKSGYKNGSAGFYDVGGVLSHSFNKRHKLNIYGYYSHDRFAFNEEEKYAYNNLNASAHWRGIFNERWTAHVSAGYDHYDYLNEEQAEETSAARLSFDIDQWFAKADFTLEAEQHALNFGLSGLLYDIKPGKYEPMGSASLIKPDELQRDKALESAIYVGEEWEVTPKLGINAGVRYSMFNVLGPREYNTYAPEELPSETTITGTQTAKDGEVVKTYHGPEFRLSARYAFNDNVSVKAGFNSMRQYIHKVSNTVIMSPTDTWKLSDANIKPQQGWQAAAGVYYDLNDPGLELSIEGYYKKMKDYLDYRNGAQLLMNHHLEMDVVNTEGYAYGVELQVKKPEGKLNGWMSYTYSRTFLRQSDKRIVQPVNDGDWYPTEYDKPHDFKLVGNYRFTKRFSVSLNMDYSTGRPTSIPAGRYYNDELGRTEVYYTDRNSYRIPDYFRMDLSLNVEPSHHLTLLTHSSISFGVYNLTGRKNVYSIYYVSEGTKVQGYRMSIFGVPIPFVTYNIKF